MRICLDARGNYFGGVYTYTHSLLRNLSEVDSELEYLILLDQHQVDEGRLLVASLEHRTIPVMSPLKMVWWNNTALSELLKREKIDLYHGLKHFGLRYPPKTQCKMIWTLHSASWWVFPELFSLRERLFWTRYYQWGARRLDHVICVSHADKKTFVEATGLTADKVSVTQLAANERFQQVTDSNELTLVRKRYQLPEQYVLFVGTIYPFKNIETILDLFARAMRKKGFSHHLVLAGDVSPAYGDTYQHKLNDQAEKLGITNKVHWLGSIFDDLPAIYTLADILVFPSFFEAFPQPPLEAMACGTPVVASDVAGLVEVIGDAGLLRGPQDIGGLTNDVVRVLDDEHVRTELIRKGFERAQHFSWERCTQNTVRVYREVLGLSDVSH